MSIALWTSYQPNGSSDIIYNETDKHEILKNMDALDQICILYKIPILSSMVDISSLLQNNHFLNGMAAQLPAEFSLPDTNSSWTNPQTALNVLQQILAHTQQYSHDEHMTNQTFIAPCFKALQEELQECIEFAHTAQKQNAKFRLELV